jgi:iduronate 2-sulfatase
MIRYLLATTLALAAARGETRPNVLLILVDDLKPALGAYGDKHAITPHLDKLAARGMRFDLAYCNTAVCAPSRFNLMTGSRSTSLGIYGFGSDFRRPFPDAVTLPQHFARHGYSTQALGKVFHIGHGCNDDKPSWTVPHYKDLVIEYRDPANTGQALTREEALFSNKHSRPGCHAVPHGKARMCPMTPTPTAASPRKPSNASGSTPRIPRNRFSSPPVSPVRICHSPCRRDTGTSTTQRGCRCRELKEHRMERPKRRKNAAGKSPNTRPFPRVRWTSIRKT